MRPAILALLDRVNASLIRDVNVALSRPDAYTVRILLTAPEVGTGAKAEAAAYRTAKAHAHALAAAALFEGVDARIEYADAATVVIGVWNVADADQICEALSHAICVTRAWR